MYTLRTFTETSEVNNWLGDQYEVVRRYENYERFAELYAQRFGRPHINDDEAPEASEETQRCYAIVITENEEQIPIFKGQSNYVMTPGGKTFSNLSYK